MFPLTVTILSMFLFFSHPLMLVIFLIAQTLLIICYTMSMMDNPWVSFMLFLIFLGGLLIIFVYLSALIPNEVIKYKTISLGLSVTMISYGMSTMNMENQTSKLFLPVSAFNLTMSSIPVMLMYLLGALCVCMYLCNYFKSPMKQTIN